MSEKKSIDHAAMREMNLALMLNTLRQYAPISRAGLANQVHLNKATVSSLVRELLTRDLVREIGVDATSNDVGRPAINLELNPDAGYLIGAEIGADYISAIVTNFAAEVRIRRYESTLQFNSQEEILDRLVRLLKDCCQEAERHNHPVLGIGMGVPGLVDAAAGNLLFAPNLGWSDVPLRQLLGQEFNIPLFLDNEANMAALGESYFGAGQGSDYVLYISAGIGLGTGIVLNGQLLSGASGFAGEAGHMILVQDGPLCNCGAQGCWETLVSQRALIRYVKEAVEAGQSSSLVAATGGKLDWLNTQKIVQAAERGDEVALNALHETGTWYGVGLANLINILNPQRVILGGVLSLGQQFILPIIEDVLQRSALRWPRESCEIVIATHGTDACMMGGIATVYRKILTQPTGWMEKDPRAAI